MGDDRMASMVDTLSPTERTRVRRAPDRAATDPALLHAVLDEALICHVGFVDDAGREGDMWDLLRLGLGEPFAVSALHGRGTGDLLDAVVDRLPAPDADELPPVAEPERADTVAAAPPSARSSAFATGSAASLTAADPRRRRAPGRSRRSPCTARARRSGTTTCARGTDPSPKP